MARNQSVSGLTEAEIEQIRKLKGRIQSECPELNPSNADAVMWAVNNELEKYDQRRSNARVIDNDE